MAEGGREFGYDDLDLDDQIDNDDGDEQQENTTQPRNRNANEAT